MKISALLLALTLSSSFYGFAQDSPITNNFSMEEKPQNLATESVWLYQPENEWTYSHHPSLVAFKGRIYAMWSNGRVDEDAPGQRVLYTSCDDFARWESPKVLLGPVQGKHSEVVLTASGFHVAGDTLVAYVGRYEYGKAQVDKGSRKPGDMGHEDTGFWALTTTDGAKWSEPRPMGIPVVPNHPPQATRSGRLIISGNISYPYTDDRSGLTGWKMTGIYPKEMENSVFDDSEGFWRVKDKMGWPVGLCEGSFFQKDDGSISMLLRSGTPVLWMTESKDDGVTWSPPRETRFSDDRAKFHCGRLPDGRFYHVGNTRPGGGRNPLVLSLSDDGVTFGRHFIIADKPHQARTPGLYKGGVYGYPHTLVYNGDFYVIVSVCKESVIVFRFPLSALSK
jgi:hypothetical protein